MCDPTWILAIFTFFLAFFTAVLAYATFRLAMETRAGTSRQIGVQTWLSLEVRFDSKGMKHARKLLAAQCDPYNPSHHDEMSEEVLELFESIATVYNEGLLNKNLATFAREMRKCDPKITSDDLKRFLADEKGLKTN